MRSVPLQATDPDTDPNQDFPADIADQAARTADRIIDQMTSQAPTLAKHNDGKTHVAISTLLNRSTAPDHTTDLLSDRLAATIREAGINRDMVFYTPADEIDPGQMAGTHYLLYGEVFAIRKNDVRYWEIFFALDEIDPARSLPRRKVWDSRQGYLIRR